MSSSWTKKKAHNLTPLFVNEESTKKPIREWVLDIETSKWTKFIVGGLYDGEKFYHFKTCEEMMKFFTLHDEREHKVWAHFGGVFDFLFCLKALIEIEGAVIKDMVPRGSGLLCFKAVLKRKLRGGAVVETIIHFTDSSALLPHSLGSLTEAFGVEHKKMDFDYESITKITPELLEYLKYDCVGLFEVLMAFKNWPLIADAGMKTTMASQALQVLRTFLTEPIHGLGRNYDAFVRASYVGGRTEPFKPAFSKEYSDKPLYCFDVNSLYPYVMLHNAFPSKCLGYSFDYDPEQMGFWDATVEVPKDMYIPPLAVMAEVKGQKKLVFPTGRFSGRWSTIELEYAASIGVKIIKIGQGLIFESGGKFFAPYIQTLWDIRCKAPKNSVHNIIAKLLMNSCYGRFGLNKDKEEILFDDGSLGLKELRELVADNGKTYRLMTKAKRINTYTNVAVAAWVTSLSRIHMHKLYLQCGDQGSRLWYTDTDSLYTDVMLPTGEGLGQLKLEYKSSSAYFLLPKTYMAEGMDGDKAFKKIVMKGFDKKKIQHFSADDFFTALEGDVRKLRIEVPERFARLKGALRQGKFVTMMPASHKSIQSTYSKRTLYKGKNGLWDSKPLEFDQA